MENYEILSGDVVVAKWQKNKLIVINEALLPLFLKKHSDLESWLVSRAIDDHRGNSRLLKKALRMKEKDDFSSVLFANGATITDNYWIRTEGSDLKYCDVRFDEVYFKKSLSKSMARLALTGNSRSFNSVADSDCDSVAELTNTGSFEKCWKNIDGKWWMYKVANSNELFSEVYIYNLCKLIGINCAVYEKSNTYVRTLDFTNGKYNFEPAFSFMGDEEDYILTIERLSEICPDAVKDYVKMIFLDALVFNPDRHTANFGLLRNQKSGKYIGLAPCFDHNMALISRGYPEGKIKEDLLIRLFKEVLAKYPQYKKYIPKVTVDDFAVALENTKMKVKSRVVIDYLAKRLELVLEQ